MRKSKAIQGQTFGCDQKDLDDTWELFVRWAGWNTDKDAKRSAKLLKTTETLERRITVLHAKLDGARAAIDALSDRQERAKQHLSQAAKAMGRFATQATLLASLKEAFPNAPPKPKAATSTKPTATQPAGADDAVRKAVMSALDRDGLHASQVAQLVGMTVPEISPVLKALIKEGKVRTDGERRGKTYALAGEGA